MIARQHPGCHATRGTARCTSGWPCSSRACATPRSDEHDCPHRSSTSTCRCPTAATARCGSRTPTATATTSACSSPPTGCRRSTASSPACRTRARCSTSSRRGGSPRTADIVRQPRASTSPTRTCSSPAPRQPLPVEVVVRGYITGVTSTSLWQQYADGAAHDLRPPPPRRPAQEHRLPRPIITPTTKAAATARHDEPLSPRRGRRNAASSTPPLWRRCEDAALALFARGQEVAAGAGLILADTKYEFGTDARRRAAADRRGAHARLVALLGGRHLRGTTQRRRGAGEPRQGGRAPGPARRRLPRRRRPHRSSPDGVGGHVAPLHRRLRTTHRAPRSSPARYPVEPTGSSAMLPRRHAVPARR